MIEIISKQSSGCLGFFLIFFKTLGNKSVDEAVLIEILHHHVPLLPQSPHGREHADPGHHEEFVALLAALGHSFASSLQSSVRFYDIVYGNQGSCSSNTCVTVDDYGRLGPLISVFQLALSNPQNFTNDPLKAIPFWNFIIRPFGEQIVSDNSFIMVF